MRVAFCTLGCKVNQYESQALGEMFVSRGHIVVPHDCEADVYIVNSCTVTATSDTKSRKTVSRLRRQNPGAVIALIGCYPQAFPDKAARVSADIVLGNGGKSRVIELSEQCFKKRQKTFSVTQKKTHSVFESMSISSFAERTRAFVKIQDGCDRFCSYCIIPMARGRICSKPIADIKSEVAALSENGYREIVLVGIDLSAYGREIGACLTDAVEAAASVSGIIRVRLGSLEPEAISDADISRLKKIKEFCPQFHLSLQSGCDKTLKRMNRHYTCDEYRDIVKKLRSEFENSSITTDVMVGFAGESESDFEASLKFVKEMRFLKVHVFPYSERKGSRAAEFEDKVDVALRRERAGKMIFEAEKIRREILKNQVGRVVKIIAEGKQKGSSLFGYTADYVPVIVPGGKDEEGSIISVRITGAEGDFCIAEKLNHIGGHGIE